jgi:hypothetical protein
LGVVFAFRPPEDALEDVVGAAVVPELELELLDPQPAANASAEQAITAAGRPLLIGTILSRASRVSKP